MAFGTLADVLSLMTIWNQGLRVGNGQADEARAILACTTAQHYFETLCATYPRIFQDTVTAATVANTETTVWNTALLRLDAAWLLDPTTNRPIRRLQRIDDVGGHVPQLPWPLQLTYSAGVGSPSGYYANMRNFYWMPLPADAQTLRLYGLLEQSEFVNRSSAFNYPNRCKAAFAEFAAKLLLNAVGDDTSDSDALAASIYRPLLKQLKKFDRSEPHGRYYTEVHTT